MPIAFIAGTDEEIAKGKGKLLIRCTQAAARLGITERRMGQLVEKGTITPYEERIYNMPLFVAEEIEELRANRLKRGY